MPFVSYSNKIQACSINYLFLQLQLQQPLWGYKISFALKFCAHYNKQAIQKNNKKILNKEGIYYVLSNRINSSLFGACYGGGC